MNSIISEHFDDSDSEIEYGRDGYKVVTDIFSNMSTIYKEDDLKSFSNFFSTPTAVAEVSNSLSIPLFTPIPVKTTVKISDPSGKGKLNTISISDPYSSNYTTASYQNINANPIYKDKTINYVYKDMYDYWFYDELYDLLGYLKIKGSKVSKSSYKNPDNDSDATTLKKIKYLKSKYDKKFIKKHLEKFAKKKNFDIINVPSQPTLFISYIKKVFKQHLKK